MEGEDFSYLLGLVRHHKLCSFVRDAFLTFLFLLRLSTDHSQAAARSSTS